MDTVLSAIQAGENNLLCQFCKGIKLRVNKPKTKVVVFEKGQVLARNEQWTFGGQRLEVVNYSCT